LPPRKSGPLRGGIVDAWVPFSKTYIDSGQLARDAPALTVIPLEECVEERLLDLYLLRIVKREVMAASNAAQIFEFGSRLHISHNITAEMQQDSALCRLAGLMQRK
jgi:hypothetical protein